MMTTKYPDSRPERKKMAKTELDPPRKAQNVGGDFDKVYLRFYQDMFDCFKDVNEPRDSDEETDGVRRYGKGNDKWDEDYGSPRLRKLDAGKFKIRQRPREKRISDSGKRWTKTVIGTRRKKSVDSRPKETMVTSGQKTAMVSVGYGTRLLNVNNDTSIISSSRSHKGLKCLKSRDFNVQNKKGENSFVGWSEDESSKESDDCSSEDCGRLSRSHEGSNNDHNLDLGREDYARFVAAMYEDYTRDNRLRPDMSNQRKAVTGFDSIGQGGDDDQNAWYDQNENRTEDTGNLVDNNANAGLMGKVSEEKDDEKMVHRSRNGNLPEIGGRHWKTPDNVIVRRRSENRPMDAQGETSELFSRDAEDETPRSVIPTDDADYDYDGVFDDPTNDDLTNFDFDHLTKAENVRLDSNQKLYVDVCHRNEVLPDALIKRSLGCTELRLNGLCLGTNRIKMLCAALVTNNHVRILEISRDVVSTQAMIYLTEALRENDLIDQLFLHDNNMGRPPVKILMEYLVYSDQVTHLSLSGNQLADDVGVMVAFYIGGSNVLVAVDLSCNEFGVNTADALSKALARNTNVHTMSLQWNHMTPKATDVFLSCLLKNRSLVNLEISWNGFDSNTMLTLGKALRANTSLTTLDISSCRLTSDDLTEIADTLKKNTALRNLILANNIFSCNAVAEFLLDLEQFKGQLNVKEIDFQEMPFLLSAKDTTTKLMIDRDLMVLHGPILGRRERESDEEVLLQLNPTTVLKEFGRIMGMDLTTLFEYMDEDGSGTLSREEIKEGLNNFNIPLPEMSLDLLIRQLDRDGDGAISLQELLVFDDQASGSLIKDILYNRERQAGGKETSSVRCRKILLRMMVEQEKNKVSLIDNEVKEADGVKDGEDRLPSQGSGEATNNSRPSKDTTEENKNTRLTKDSTQIKNSSRPKKESAERNNSSRPKKETADRNNNSRPTKETTEKYSSSRPKKETTKRSSYFKPTKCSIEANDSNRHVIDYNESKTSYRHACASQNKSPIKLPNIRVGNKVTIKGEAIHDLTRYKR